MAVVADHNRTPFFIQKAMRASESPASSSSALDWMTPECSEMLPADIFFRLREAWIAEDRRALLWLMVELWDRVDELECRKSTGIFGPLRTLPRLPAGPVAPNPVVA